MPRAGGNPDGESETPLNFGLAKRDRFQLAALQSAVQYRGREERTWAPEIPWNFRVALRVPPLRAQLRVLRPDLEVVELRGNVDTRLARRDRGDVDALMLAAAGLVRLGIVREDILVLAPPVCVPAPGQGLLAIEGRTGDWATREALAVLDDVDAHLSLIAERAVLQGMGGGCMTPIGALCVPSELGLHVTAFCADDAEGTGARQITVTSRERDPIAIGRAAVGALRQDVR